MPASVLSAMLVSIDICVLSDRPAFAPDAWIALSTLLNTFVSRYILITMKIDAHTLA